MTTQKLDVHRCFSNGQQHIVGQLAQNRQGIYFQYDEEYLKQFNSLSPFTLPFNNTLHKAPRTPHQGLHGAFSDSLPDGWGLLLMDRVFRQHGRLPQQITLLERLAYIGSRGMGALRYSPASEYTTEDSKTLQRVSVLGQEAQRIFEGQTDEVLTAVANAGGSGGARPKAMIYFDPDQPEYISTSTESGFPPWLIKFTSQSLPLGHEEGLCEAAWLTMAQEAGITTPEWQLVHETGNPEVKGWLALKRFDCPNDQPRGRYHMQTLCGLVDADFRQPSMDYEDLIKVSQVICQSPIAAQEQFTRALFNLFSMNQDDHTKNWSFLMDDHGQWQLAPFYDATFSPTPYNQHSTAFGGYGSQPPLKVIQKLAAQANFESWNQAKESIQRIVEALASWGDLANQLGIKNTTRRLISQQLSDCWQLNKQLIK